MSQFISIFGAMAIAVAAIFGPSAISASELPTNVAACCCGDDCDCKECGCADGKCTNCNCAGCNCKGCECGGDCGSAVFGTSALDCGSDDDDCCGRGDGCTTILDCGDDDGDCCKKRKSC